MTQWEALSCMALDLTAALTTQNRYQRLLDALKLIAPFDAAFLFRLQGDELTPLAVRGLAADVAGRRFARANHPRLDLICKGFEPVLFPKDSPLPDPFDGLLAPDQTAQKRIQPAWVARLSWKTSLSAP